MKDINKGENSDFEKDWQKAFENAEASPGTDLWNNIDSRLANNDASNYKRKLIFYKWVAAASIVFALGLTYFNYANLFKSNVVAFNDNNKSLHNDNSIQKNTDQSVESATSNPEPDFNNGKISAMEGEQDKQALNLSQAESTPSGNLSSLQAPSEAVKNSKVAGENLEESSSAGMERSKSGERVLNTKDVGQNRTLIVSDKKILENKTDKEISSEKPSRLIAELDKKALVKELANQPAIITSKPLHSTFVALNSKGYDLEFYSKLLDPPFLYLIPGVLPLKMDSNDDADHKKLWAGLNVGSSVFDPQFQSGTNFQPKTSPALSQTIAREAPQAASYVESTDPGVSYSFGVNFGVMLSEKWVLQSGVQYAHRNSSTNSTTFLTNNKNVQKQPNFLGASQNDVVSSSEIGFTKEYDLRNSFEFASVPLKAGYVLIDSKVGVMLSAGVGADLFLSNTVSENNDKIAEVKVDAGSDSPFRDLNFNGLFGAEIFYEISDQYHLTLEPNYSIALSPFTKSSTSFQSNPQLFGITAGLKYFWK